MHKRVTPFSIYLLGVYFLIHPQCAHAVIPPDFVFNIGTQIAQFFSVTMVFFATIFGGVFHFFKTKYYTLRYRKTVLALAIFSLIAIALGSSYLYALQKQRVEYQRWLEGSWLYDGARREAGDSRSDASFGTGSVRPDTVPHTSDGDNGSYVDDAEDQNIPSIPGSGEMGDEAQSIDENDQLTIGGEYHRTIDTSPDRFVLKVGTRDTAAKFISEYYGAIAQGDLKRAYEISKKSVDYDTFRSWYRVTTKIILDKFVRIDETRSSIELTLFEGDSFIRYGVLMTLELREGVPIRVESSEVKILTQGVVENSSAIFNERVLEGEYSFFDQHKEKNISITNQEFQAYIDKGVGDIVVLDAREDVEYENGFFPGSAHIRFADLKAGRWIELPNDQFVYVICWSGIRGKEVAEFLRTKKIVASYLEHGAETWVKFGGRWVGSIQLSEQYNDPRYRRVFDTDEVQERVKEGAVLVDTREPSRFIQRHIADSINIPIMFTPTIHLEDVLNQVPPRRDVITVCDNYVNCFDAKLTGIELERHGHKFLGRYPKPWEYEE